MIHYTIMRCIRRLGAWIVVFILFSMILGQAGTFLPAPVHAQAGSTPTPTPETRARKTTLTLDYTAHEWWLARYSNNDIVCHLVVEHEGLPSGDEVLTACQQNLYNQWAATQPCSYQAVGGDLSKCPGLYLLHAASWPDQQSIEVELPLPAVWLSIDNCNSAPETPSQCTSLPSLLLSGEEPLPNEQIIAIYGYLNGSPFSCPGASCSLPLQPTTSQGIEVEFWAESSFGDTSEHYSALLRVLPWGDFMAPEGNTNANQLWYTDILSSQWRGGSIASCSDTWQVFPDVGGPPAWLSSPATAQELYSSYSFYYLAGMLIQSGEVDVSSCLDGGMQSETVASPCGVEAAYPKLLEWQNQFDAEIFQTAQDTGIPAQLLKNVFTRESQFWPGIYTTYKEAGLGQLTEKGADTMLLWNPAFYTQFCPLVLYQARCDLGFGNLKEEEQNMLRGALVRKVNASCPDCPSGIDLTQANFSVRVFAEGLKANCEQTSRLLRNITGVEPRNLASYVDLWKFTLANYNAGPGCLWKAVKTTWALAQPIDWEHVSPNLEPACYGAVGYVDDISRVLSGFKPTPTSWVYQGTPIPAVTQVIVPTRTPTPTSLAPTPTPPGYPNLTPTPTPTPASYPNLTTTPVPTQPGYN